MMKYSMAVTEILIRIWLALLSCAMSAWSLSDMNAKVKYGKKLKEISRNSKINRLQIEEKTYDTVINKFFSLDFQFGQISLPNNLNINGTCYT